jgi:peptidoglycan hydrolase-like protein with peptidoglycan-binding domain
MAVKFKRSLKYRYPKAMHGYDVRAIQITLVDRKIRKRKPTGDYGTSTKAEIKEFQSRNNLTQDGIYGPATHAKLATLMGGWAEYLYSHQKVIQQVPYRKEVVGVAWFGLNNADETHYAQIRPMGDMDPPPSIPRYADCSKFVTWCYKSAKAPDPNGFSYSGYGFTGTLVTNGNRVSSARPADLVFYSNPDHVAIYVGNGSVISDGSEPAPFLCRYNYRPVTQIRSYLP